MARPAWELLCEVKIRAGGWSVPAKWEGALGQSGGGVDRKVGGAVGWADWSVPKVDRLVRTREVEDGAGAAGVDRKVGGGR